MAGWKYFQVGIIRVRVFLGGNCPGGTYPGWDFSLVEVFLVEIIRMAIYRVGVFMLPKATTSNSMGKIHYEISRFKGISWNTFILGSQLLLIDKKSVNREKMTSDSEDLITLILINNICYSKSKSKKKSKRPKGIWMKPWLKNRNDKSAYNNIFSELLLTYKEEFRRYLRMNTTSYEVSNITKFPAAYITFTLLVCFKQILCGYLI